MVEKTTFFTGLLNVIPSPYDLGKWLQALPATGCVLARDPLLKTRSPSKGVPLKITTTSASSYVDIPTNLYKSYNGDFWEGSVYVSTNTSTPTNIKIGLYITDYNGSVLQTAETTLVVSNQWIKRTFFITNTSTDAPPPSVTNDGNPNQIRIKIFGPTANGVQVWLDDLRLHRNETVMSIFKSTPTLDGDHPLRDPFSYYENMYFDTRFDYFNIPGNITYNSITVTLPYRPNQKIKKRKKPGRTRRKRWVDVPISGYSKTTGLAHNLGKIPIAITYEPGGAYFGGSTIIQSVGTGSFRTAWVTTDENNLYINERWYTVFNPLPAITITLDCYIFNEPASVITTAPAAPVYEPGQPLVIGTIAGDLATSSDGQTNDWKSRLEGASIVDGASTQYLYNIVSLFYLNGKYYAYHREAEGPLVLPDGSVQFANEYWSGWTSDNRALGWSSLDNTLVPPLQEAMMVPGSTTDAVGISISESFPKSLIEVYGEPADPTDPNSTEPFLGYGTQQPLPYKVYTSSNKGETWTQRGTLPSSAPNIYGSGGAGVACTSGGNAVAVGCMLGGESVEKVNIIGTWDKFDNENFTPKTVSITFSAPEIPGGITATGQPIIDKYQKLVGISMTNRGSGYIQPPTITITDTDTTPNPGTVTVTANNTRTVAPVYDGFGNLVSPEQKFWKVGSATASGTSGLHKRTTTITFSNGATANLTFNNGQVTTISITNTGSEVGPSASAPTITATISDTDDGTEVLGTAVAVLTSGRCKKPTAAYSTDFGLTWNASTLPTVDFGGLCDVEYASAGGFVAVGQNNLILKSSNGSSWTNVSPSSYSKQTHWQRVIYAKSNYFCCGFNNGSSFIIKSSDGSSWSEVFNISNVCLQDIAHYIFEGKLIAAGGEAGFLEETFSGPNVVYPGEACWLKITGAKPGTIISITGSEAAASYSNSATVDNNGEVLLGNLAGSFSLGTLGATNNYTYSFVSPITFNTITHTVRYVEQVSNSIYTSPTSNSSDYTNTTGYWTEAARYKPNEAPVSRTANIGKTYITSDGNSWTNIVNGPTKYINRIIASSDYIP